MSEKRKKELLAAISDGLDVLLGLEKEEKKEVKEREKPADTFSGLLQSLIPLVILPSVMPLFQQAFGQTLRETTVNVKVESATSIIPIDITAQTAILAVDIRAQTVTLNIRIVESVTTINVNIIGSVTLSVTVQGAADIRIIGQTIGVYLGGTYQTQTGQEVNLTGFTSVGPYGSGTIAVYSPSGSDVYLIEGMHASYRIPRDTMVKPDLIVFTILTGYDEIAWLSLTDETTSNSLVLIRAVRISSATPLTVRVTNYSPVVVGAQVSVFMYKVT